MAIVWITHPDNYDPVVHEQLKREGQDRIELFESRGFDVRVVHSSQLVPAWSDGPRLWLGEEDLLASADGFMLSSWTWDAAAIPHVQAIARTIRASSCALLNDAMPDAESLGSDKLAMCHFAGALEVPVLPTVAVSFGRYARRAIPVVRRELPPGGYVVKPRDMAMGFGVLKVDTIEQLTAAIDLLTPGGLGCIVQPFHPNTGDIRVYVHRGCVIAAMMRRPPPGSYLANISEHGSLSAATVPADLAELSQRLARALGAGYLCVDWLLSETGPVFNEWMTVAAGFEDLPEPERSKVADALFDYIAERLRG